MNNQKEVAAARLGHLFATLNLAALGSLWFVPEDIWKAMHAGHYDEHNTRDGHPGCSLRRMSSDCSLDPIPLLHGRSKKTGQAVPVDSVLSKGHPTFFGSLPPVPVPCSSWQGHNRIKPSLKPKLSSTEQKSVIDLCTAKGWL